MPRPRTPPETPRPAPPAGAASDPPRLLLTGPPGSGKTTALLERFSAALREGTSPRALLVLPTYGEVEHAKRLAVSHRGDRGRVDGLLDEAYATFTSLGERLYPDVRVRHLPSRVERDLLAEAALLRAAISAFEAVRDRKGFRARFLRLVKEMKQTGDDPAAVRVRARAAAASLSEAPSERLSGFVSAWEAYDALLAEGGAPDHEDALQDLLGRIRREPPAALRGLALLAVDGFDDLSGLEGALLSSAAAAVTAGGGRVVVTLPFDPARPALFGPSRALIERLVRESGFVERRLDGFARSDAPPLAALAANLFRDGAGPPVAAEPAVFSIVGADPADEIDRIGREILRLCDPERSDLRVRPEGQPPIAFRDVGIVLRRLDARGVPARRRLEALGIPTRLVGGGARLASEPAVRALVGPLRLLAGEDGREGAPFDAGALLDHARWRALASGSPVPVASVDAADLRFRSTAFPADFASLRRGLVGVERAMAPLLDDLETRRGVLASARGPEAVYGALLDAVAALLPLEEPSGFLPDGSPVDPDGDARLARARAAKGRLLALVGELREATERTKVRPGLLAAEAVEEVLAAAEEAACEPSDRRLDAVSLLDAEEARHWEVSVCFVAGLVEKEFPLHPREDLFLRDADRSALRGEGAGIDLRTARDAEDRERRLFLSAATRARSRLYLCRHAGDADGRAKAASFLWKDVEAVVHGPEKDGKRAPLSTAPADLGRAAVPPEEAVLAGDLLAFATSRLGALPAGKTDEERRLAVAILREGGPLADSAIGRAARFRRTGADDMRASARDTFVESVREISPTQATTAVSCLHRHFLKHVADVPEDKLPLSGAAMDRREMGTLLHRALHRALLHPKESAEDVAADVMKTALAEYPDSAERDFIASDLVRVVRLFRVREEAAAAAGFSPMLSALEVRFGEEVGRPVSLGEGTGAFHLKGSIDRVDVGADGRSALVVDYKSSKGTVEKAFKELKDSRDLQLALYARAVERSMDLSVVGMELYAAFVRHRRMLVRKDLEPVLFPRREGGAVGAIDAAAFEACLAEAEGKTSRAVEAVRKGTAAALPRAPVDASECDDCAYRAVCRPDSSRFPRTRPDEDSP